MVSFKDFLPSHYSNLIVYNKKHKQKFSIRAELLISFYAVASDQTVVVFYEGKQKRMVLTPYTLHQIRNVFSEGD